MQKFKAAGLNTMSIYGALSYHFYVNSADMNVLSALVRPIICSGNAHADFATGGSSTRRQVKRTGTVFSPCSRSLTPASGLGYGSSCDRVLTLTVRPTSFSGGARSTDFRHRSRNNRHVPSLTHSRLKLTG